MKILHTADVHLKQDDSETVEALKQVLTKAEELEVDLLTIGGDLFDSSEDAEALRPELRELLKNNSFDILAIPGNHDEDVYRENLRFGNDLDILTDTPYEIREFGDIEIIGVPFQSSMDDELFSALKENSSDQTQLMLLHCTLDIGFKSGGVGEEEGEYFPITKATLAELDYDYVLAGHIHSTDREVPLDNGGTFIYPGSPVSHSTKETGQRKTVLIDTEEESVSSVPLRTFYYDSFSEMVRPGEEDEVVNEIEDWVNRREEDNCELTVSVDGFVDRDENEFYEELENAAGPAELSDSFRSVSSVLDHPLYQRFMEKLEEKEDLEEDEVVKDRVIQVLSQLLAQNKVQAS
ncbi:metallophosphoesterase family protein [Salinirussus salinus]|uniref:metallophosphoesterase family protein n=1 Tax=Salinirussus salinus TaxID=1198300 RepID=UPI0013579E06|nr:DNA repair exonuclease [Salinirussus salinus]